MSEVAIRGNMRFLYRLRKYTYALIKFPSHLREIRQETSPVRLAEERKTFLKALLEYIMEVGKDIRISYMENELEAVASDEVREIYMTLAEQFIARGKVQGRLEGQILAKQQVLLRLLKKRFGPVDDAEKPKIRNCRDRGRLDQAIDLLLDAETTDQVLQPLE